MTIRLVHGNPSCIFELKKNKDMNNNIIKSLRRTLLNTVAAAVVSIGFTACADEIFETQNNTAPANTYKISIPASIGGGDTRAIAYNSQTGGYDATFEVSDFVFVYDVTKKAEGRKQSGGDWIATNLRPDENGKKVNLIGELAFAVYNSQTSTYSPVTPEIGDELMLFYNSTQNIYYNIQGNSIADYAIAKVKITSINDGVITTGPSSFQNPQSIYKINFTGLASTLKIKNVLIQSAQKKLVWSYQPVNLDDGPDFFGNVSYIYAAEGTDQHELTFMLRFSDNPNYPSTSGDEITFLALGSDGHNYRGTKNVSSDLDNGKYYQADMAMTDAGLAMKLTNTTTGETVELNKLNRWNKISTTDAAYVATNTGYDTSFEWYGGDKKLTFKNLSIYNSNGVFEIYSNENSEDSKIHYLVLDGENTFGCIQDVSALNVSRNNTLIISALSKGKLNITGNGYINLEENTKLIIEGGEVKVDQYIRRHSSARVFLSGDTKLSIKTENVDDFIKAANGYILQTAKEDDYTVYTVKAADPYEQPKALSSATSADLGKIIGSDGNIHVLNWDLPNGISPVAMIASISSTGHGLAIAMEAIRKNSDDYRNGFSWDNSGEANDGKTATEIFQNWATNNEVSFGTWRIPSKSDCQDMILGCRIDGDATVASDENMTSNGFGTKLVAAGICTDDYFYFGTWTSTSGQDGEIYLGTNKSENGSFVAGFYNSSFSSTTTIFPVLEF